MNLPRHDGPQQRETHDHGSQPWKQTGRSTRPRDGSTAQCAAVFICEESHECHETDRRTSDDK